MKVEKIEEKLTQLFTTHRIIFWYDADGEFDETFASLSIGDIKVIRLDEYGVFATKIRIEFDDPHGRYLIYAPFSEPEDKDDWLLDTRIYSHTFRADMASIILDDLGLKNKSLRAHIRGRKKFFASKERTEKLKKWISPEDTAEDIDLKMLCVITKAIQPSAFAIPINILDGLSESGCFDPSSESKVWGDIQRLGIEDACWRIMRDSFGYEDTNPGLSALVIHLVVTDFAILSKGHIRAHSPAAKLTMKCCASIYGTTM